MAFLMPKKRGEGVLRQGGKAELKPANLGNSSQYYLYRATAHLRGSVLGEVLKILAGMSYPLGKRIG